MKPYFLIYFHLFTLTLMCIDPNTTFALLGNESDHLALLQFKQSISSDPYGILHSWNSSTHFCKWHGIMCSPKHHQRVTKLDLQGYKLHGFISPHVGNLSQMRFLNLINNSFNGEISQELGRLSRLRYLFLWNNSLVGELPINLTKCSELKRIDLGGNHLTGKIPDQFGSLQKLENLLIDCNKLFGKIPPSIWNLSTLIQFRVSYNNLEGKIPEEICFLQRLNIITLDVNNLSGIFPSCVYNMSSLIVISAADNRFRGSLTSNMFHTLLNLGFFSIPGNQFSGSIPTSISNASNLALFNINSNYFVGQIPNLGKLQSLWHLGFNNNNIGDNSTKDLLFLKSLTNCSNLEVLGLANNNFGGSLPNSIGNLSTLLSQLVIGGNQIYGNIPTELGNLINLILLGMQSNNLEGIIPSTFGKFKNMQKLVLWDNNLSGNIPYFISNLSQLYYLVLGKNLFEGNIPPIIGSCQNLQILTLSQNNLKGVIPFEIFNISSLSNTLDLSDNFLSGRLPTEVGMLKNIYWLDVSENVLSGKIPETIGECINLQYLNLRGNSFSGIIPSSLESLKGLQNLDMSRNHLSGPIPNVLQNISFLVYFNVSFNMLEGEVPTDGVFRNASGFAMIGNNKLCGGISELHLPPCPVKSRKHSKNHDFKLKLVIISAISFIFIISIIIAIYWRRKRNHIPFFGSPTINQLVKVSYQDLHRGTDGFSDRNLIGSGSFGSVYKGILESEDNVVAVKVLNLQRKGATKSFIIECNTLKNIRHRNLVKILTCCSSIDYEGKEFKALVFCYMKNGSLEQWLHPKNLNEEHTTRLDLLHRLNIINDVACALHYLHQECDQLVVHCDLKPSNVLLDEDMVAHVSDFGIAKLVSTIGENNSTSGIKGTIGYAPPEYGISSKVSTCGDMYSFGILMLEMLTGRRPTDEVLQDGQNLHNFVAISFPDNLIKILDSHIVSRDIEDGENVNLIPSVEECLVSLFKIGLACSMESPKERMNIADVTGELTTIRKTFLARCSHS